MKKIFQLTAILLLTATGFWSCADDTDQDSGYSDVRFSLNVERYEDGADSSNPQTRADGSPVTQLVTAVYNSEGTLQRNVLTETSADNSHVSVEGLIDGTYKVIFMGVGTVLSGETPVINAPSNISDNWLGAYDDKKPCLDEYFYAETQVVVEGGKVSSQTSVTMRRIVGLVEIAPIPDNSQFPLGSITKLTVTFDSGMLFSGHSPQSGYTGSTQLSAYETSAVHQFYTLPTRQEGTAKGHITIYGKRYDGEIYSQQFPFEVTVIRNKKTIIRPHYDIEGEIYGTMRLYDYDRNASNSRLFFQDGDSYKNVAARSFYPAYPLTVSFDNERKKATLSFYSITDVKDVTILAKRKNDKEYFELAWLESMKALEERTVDLPESRIYRTESGGAIYIGNLGTDRLFFKYRSESQFLQKINKITWPMKIQFMTPNADTLTLKNAPLAIRPVHAREAVVQFTNMAYVLSNGWKEKMLASEQQKPMTDNGRVVSLTNEVFPKIWQPNSSYDHITFHIINYAKSPTQLGVSNVGNGDYFGMAQTSFFNFYANDEYVIKYATPYHEYGHLMGYNHNGSFTYNEMQQISGSLHKSLYSSGQTPYTSNTLNSWSNPNIYTW